jgi:hypothetical protein
VLKIAEELFDEEIDELPEGVKKQRKVQYTFVALKVNYGCSCDASLCIVLSKG